jgi:hypothetical protein
MKKKISNKNEFENFTSTGEGAISIQLIVTTSDFSTQELVEEVCLRDLDDMQKSELLASMEISTELIDSFGEYNGETNKMSLSDQMKLEYLMKVFSKYTLQEIESKLPE